MFRFASSVVGKNENIFLKWWKMVMNPMVESLKIHQLNEQTNKQTNKQKLLNKNATSSNFLGILSNKKYINWLRDLHV